MYLNFSVRSLSWPWANRTPLPMHQQSRSRNKMRRLPLTSGPQESSFTSSLMECCLMTSDTRMLIPTRCSRLKECLWRSKTKKRLLWSTWCWKKISQKGRQHSTSSRSPFSLKKLIDSSHSTKITLVVSRWKNLSVGKLSFRTWPLSGPCRPSSMRKHPCTTAYVLRPRTF